MRDQQVDTRCGYLTEQGERCEQEGNPCWLGSAYEEPHEYLCGKHMFQSGYCPGCGLFWGGVESFEFSDHHLCENCESELREEDDEMEATYSSYPFDCEEDWGEEEDD